MNRSIQSVAALSTTLVVTSLAMTNRLKTSSGGEDNPIIQRDKDGANTVATTMAAPPLHQSERTAARKLQSVCKACHVGIPWGPAIFLEKKCVFDKPVGSVYPDYPYTEALRNSGIVWNESIMDTWLEDPNALVPGTVMSFDGVKDPNDRQEIIALMKSFCEDSNSTEDKDPTASPSTDESSNSASSGAMPILTNNNCLSMGNTIMVGLVLFLISGGGGGGSDGGSR